MASNDIANLEDDRHVVLGIDCARFWFLPQAYNLRHQPGQNFSLT